MFERKEGNELGERKKHIRRGATVARLSEKFVEERQRSVKPSTLACYRRNIRCHILPQLGQRVAAELQAAEVFTEPELKRIGRTILRQPDEMGLGVLLTAHTGIRLGELCGLQWQDVDAQTGLLHIRRTVERALPSRVASPD